MIPYCRVNHKKMVLLPLSKVIVKNNSTRIFVIFFGINIVILEVV